jgi:glutamate-1-semialdehyde 2,1-aminomutase
MNSFAKTHHESNLIKRPSMPKPLPESARLLSEAQAVMPGGVSSPVRAFRNVGGVPAFITRGLGARVEDADGNGYIDLVMSYGPLLDGHASPRIIAAIQHAAMSGTSFGAPTEAEIKLAQEIVARVPSVEMVRFVNSGTEATMSALRLARAATGRSAFIKFDGCYHGHADSFLVRVGSGALTHGAPDSQGVPVSVAADTLIAQYNDLDSVDRLFRSHPSSIAAVFVEPVVGNIGCVLPDKGFLEGLRTLCDAHGALLVFDEVMTGFRVARGGYQAICGVMPDLTTMGKIIGGGLPVGAYGGRASLMQLLSPVGQVYQAGTLSGNPLAMAAGLTALRIADEGDCYAQLEDSGAHLQAGIEHILADLKIPGVVNRQGSMMGLYFSERPVRTLKDVMAADGSRFQRFFHRMLEEGVMLPPSPYESWFLSTRHDAEVLDQILEAVRNSLASEY